MKVRENNQSVAMEWPKLPSVRYEPVVNQTLEVYMPSVAASAPITSTAMLYAAWTLLLSQYAHTDEVAFGTSVFPSTVQQGAIHVSPFKVAIPWEADLAKWLSDIEVLIGELESQLQSSESFQCRSIILETHSQQQKTNTKKHQQLINELSLSYRTAIILEPIFGAANELAMIRFHFDGVLLEPVQAKRMLVQLQHTFQQLSFQADPVPRVVDIDMCGDEDKAQIWRWNAMAPREINAIVPDLFTAQVKQHGNRSAVDAWDGLMTYAELDRASTSLAIWLLEKGIAGPGRVIPWCYNKSIWTTVTLLAIAKSGSIFVALDPQQPIGRLRAIFGQLDAAVILARPDTLKIASSLGVKVEVVGDAMLHEHVTSSRLTELLFRPVLPTDDLYIVFTSGSTGTPKGAIISHANLCSGSTHQSIALGYAGSRVLDSSTYSFDAYVCNTFHALLHGGILCVPSDGDQTNNLQSVLQKMKVEFVQLTPSTSRLVDPNQLPLLHTLVLTGEKITRTVLKPWLTKGDVRIVNAYGPSECTIMCAANTNIKTFEDAQSVGTGLGSNLWLADVHDITRLAPIGAVGEVLIEGPIVGQGYLGDPQKTKESLVFVEGRYLQGMTHTPTSPLFRTRDLAKYNTDGSLSFIGRLDTQIKINGQRVEIEEVEYHLGQHLSTGISFVVEPVQWPSGIKQLIGFICGSFSGASLEVHLEGITEKLSDALPSYMIPSAYFPLDNIPMTSSGKIDRKTLREMAIGSPGQLLDAQRRVEKDGVSSLPASVYEPTLKRLWAKLFQVNESTISRTSNFFSKGDSLVAMELVALTHKEGLDGLNVADIITNPILKDLARVLESHRTRERPQRLTEQAPFSLLRIDTSKVNAMQHTLADAFGCDATDLEDVYPCSPFQEQMVMLHALNTHSFATQVVVPLPSTVHKVQLRAAWDRVAQKIPILRTRIWDANSISPGKPNFVQGIVKSSIPWSEYSSQNECLLRERDKGMELGKPLVRVAVVQPGEGEGEALLVVTMHHAAYDEWFLRLLSDALRNEYFGRGQKSLMSYRDFIEYLEISNGENAEIFWKNYLKDPPEPLPLQLLSPNSQPSVNNIIEHKIYGVSWDSLHGVTPATFIKTAWGLTLSKNSLSSDVIFGSTLLGRDGGMANMELIGGPTIAIVPVRILIDWSAQSATELLRQVAHQHAEAIPFQHFGIECIKRLNPDTDTACRFSTFLVVQTAHSDSEDSAFDLSHGKDDLAVFGAFPIFLECSLSEHGIFMRTGFDSHFIDNSHVEKLVSDFERVIRTLSISEQNRSLLDLDILSNEDKDRILASPSQSNSTWIRQTELHFQHCLPPGLSEFTVDVVKEDNVEQTIGFITGSTFSKEQIAEALANAERKLVSFIPHRHLPTKFLVVEGIPVDASGEKDPGALKALARSAPSECFINAQRLVQPQYMSEEPQTASEQILVRLWSRIFNMDPNSIQRSSSFLFLGGDSLTAMRLVAGLREQGFFITVPEVLEAPRLADMAMRLELRLQKPQSVATQVSPFTLLPPGVDMEVLAQMCNIDLHDIEDAYPCSSLQEAMIARTAREANSYVSHYLIQLPDDVNAVRLKEAWDYVSRISPILRTRLVDGYDYGLLQVVVKTSVSWTEVPRLEDVESYSFGFGQPLLRLELIKKTPTGGQGLRMSIHHAIYDKESLKLILDTIDHIYHGKTVPRMPIAYNYFIQYLIKDMNVRQAEEFWREYLADLSTSPFPALPSPKYQPKADKHLEHTMKGIELPTSVTPATTLKSAWAITVSQYSNSVDVVFGSVTSGRQVALAGIELIEGPTLAIIPLRVKVDWSSSPIEFLASMQNQSTRMVPHEQIGLKRLNTLNEDTQRACHFQSLFVVQPVEYPSVGGELFLSVTDRKEASNADMYGVVLECTWNAMLKEISFNVSFDDSVINAVQVRYLVDHLDHVIHQLGKPALNKVALREMDLLPPAHRQKLVAANAIIPTKVECRVGDLIAKRALMQPDALAIEAWDGNFSYRQLYDQALSFAHCLAQHHNVGPDIVVPICCAKSRWTPIAMLATILTGSVTLLLDPFQPVERLQGIVKQTNATFIIASPCTQEIAARLIPNVVVLAEHFVKNLQNVRFNSSLPESSPDDACYISFTSGSTGAPKGAIITHSNCCSALKHQTEAYGTLRTTRTLDLSSYSFDIVWHEFLFTFSTGACLCIPSDDQRRNDLIGAIQQFDVNYLHLTPSLARTIDPTQLPSIRTVVFGGEPLALEDITRWGSDIDIRDGYGPTECTITSTIAIYGRNRNMQPNIGRAYGLNAWVVSCLQPGELAPLGGVGELVVEGPLVGRGYLNNSVSTRASFVDTLTGHVDDPKRNLYRTGDLVRYSSCGELIYVGRKDLQVKLRGQRIELGEVEAHARREIGDEIIVVADVVEPDDKTQVLAMFLSPSTKDKSNLESTNEAARTLAISLPRILPAYMVPSSFVVMAKLPLTATGKVDRKKLKAHGARELLDEKQKRTMRPVLEPLTEAEAKLREAWSQVLDIDARLIGRDDRFLELGGDSLSAIRLVSAARKLHLPLSVAMIFQHSRLEDMARALGLEDNSSSPLNGRVDAFAPPHTNGLHGLKNGQRDNNAKRFADIDQSFDNKNIYQILRLTEFQDYAVRAALHTPRTEVNYFWIRFHRPVNIERLQRACQHAVDALEILRTHFVKAQDGYAQLVLKHSTANVQITKGAQPLEDLCKTIARTDGQERLGPNTTLAKFFIIQSAKEAQTGLMLRISHAQYDAFSLHHTVNVLAALYSHRQLPPLCSFSSYIMRACQTHSSSYDYWRTLLKDAPAPTLLSVDSRKIDLIPGPRIHLTTIVRLPQVPKGVTAATVFSAAWASALCHVTGSNEVVFGRAVSGRNGGSHELDAVNVVGPCLNIVPVRAANVHASPRHEIMHGLQEQFNNSIPHETIGLQEIATNCTSWPGGTEFGSVIYFQSVARDFVSRFGEQGVRLEVLDVPGALEPAEPPRLNVWPELGYSYRLELTVPQSVCHKSKVEALLRAVEEYILWLSSNSSSA